MANTPPHLGGHNFVTHVDSGALEYLIRKFSIKSMVDIGCGPGGMGAAARDRGVRWFGVDGDPVVKPEGAFMHHDFSQCPFPWDRFYPDGWDLAWSVEFLEHVEAQFISNFLPLFASARVVAVTAAPPGWSGHHHVNCQPESYWHEVFARYGLHCDSGLTTELRGASTMTKGFMKNTGMLFIRS